MGTILLDNPWLQVYLVLVGALWIAFFWDYARRSRATKDDSGTPRQQRLPGQLRFLPAANNNKLPRSLSRPRRWTD
jgi:hypothetical protein